MPEFHKMTSTQKRQHRLEIAREHDKLQQSLAYYSRQVRDRQRLEEVAQAKLDAAQQAFDCTIAELDKAEWRIKAVQNRIVELGKQTFTMDHAPKLSKLEELAHAIREVELIKERAER